MLCLGTRCGLSVNEASLITAIAAETDSLWRRKRQRESASFCNRMVATVRFWRFAIPRRDHECYPRPMPVRVAVMCEKCERIYLLAHPDSGKRIRFTPSTSDSHPPYQLTCICRGERYFDKAHTLPYRVSEYTCTLGYADRDEYIAVPSQKSPTSRG